MRRGLFGIIAVLSAVAGVGASAFNAEALAAEVYPRRAIEQANIRAE